MRSQFNRRETSSEPTKSGIVGLLAAAQGRRRADPIEDLVDLQLGVRTDQPGSLLRDYHTVSDYRGCALPSVSVNSKGTQKPTAPAKFTHVTERFYLEDAVFVVAVGGNSALLSGLAEAVQKPAFPLSLGRRACVPSFPLLLEPGSPDRACDRDLLWEGPPALVLEAVPWQASAARRQLLQRQGSLATAIDLPISVDDPSSPMLIPDVPRTFAPASRAFTTRTVRYSWVSVATGFAPPETAGDTHDPFALLGW